MGGGGVKISQRGMAGMHEESTAFVCTSWYLLGHRTCTRVLFLILFSRWRYLNVLNFNILSYCMSLMSESILSSPLC